MPTKRFLSGQRLSSWRASVLARFGDWISRVQATKPGDRDLIARKVGGDARAPVMGFQAKGRIKRGAWRQKRHEYVESAR
jgi:hypothetical protein